MKLSEVKEKLEGLNQIIFELPHGARVPIHFHVTEVGLVQRDFIDCGGSIRKERKVNFQLWEADDFDHRLAPQKLKDIIELSENKLQLTNEEVEVEYQGATIGKYTLDFKEGKFLLINTQTDCLAKDNCGIPPEKMRVSLSSLSSDEQKCAPGGGCC